MRTRQSTRIELWFERDRSFVGLSDAATGEVILEAWDDDVAGLVEDGFLNPRDWHGSARGLRESPRPLNPARGYDPRGSRLLRTEVPRTRE